MVTSRSATRGRLRTSLRQVVVATVAAWAAVFVIATFFGFRDYATHVGFGALIVGALVVAAGLFGRQPIYRYARVASFGWLPGGDRSADGPADGLTMLGIALFVAPPLFVVGALMAG